MIVPTVLPLPSTDQQAQSRKLMQYLCHAIDCNGGTLPFSEYFNICLYHADWGYYTSSLPKFGAGGDFVTAPVISPYFSRCLAVPVADVLRCCELPIIVEIGAGNGMMAETLLTELKKQNQLPDKYLILELSESLIAQQQARLAETHKDIYSRIEWIRTPPDFAWEGVLLANEVIDALPVERFSIREGTVYSMNVGYVLHGTQVQFTTCYQAADEPLLRLIDELKEKGITFSEGYESEYCAVLAEWIQAMTRSMQRGAAFFIDYGYEETDFYRSDRVNGTLIAHFQHRVHNDLYCNPGIQDLTANVNFTALAEAGLAAGLNLLGYTTQMYFLFDCGLETLLNEDRAQLSELEWFKVSQAVQLLISPAEMGERFKVMAFGRNMAQIPSGFALNELSHRL